VGIYIKLFKKNPTWWNGAQTKAFQALPEQFIAKQGYLIKVPGVADALF
jgi:hypothetical protein